MNSYLLSRIWFAFAYDNPKVKPVHTALYFWIVERANASGWKKLIDIQTEKSMECLGVTDWRTYKNAIQFLVDSGFIIWVEKSRNQYTCNRISLVENAFELSEAVKNGNAQNVKALAQNAEAIAEAIAEAYAEADVEAIAEALQSYINLKTNKPINLKTTIGAAAPETDLGFTDSEQPFKEKEKKASHTGGAAGRKLKPGFLETYPTYWDFATAWDEMLTTYKGKYIKEFSGADMEHYYEVIGNHNWKSKPDDWLKAVQNWLINSATKYKDLKLKVETYDPDRPNREKSISEFEKRMNQTDRVEQLLRATNNEAA